MVKKYVTDLVGMEYEEWRNGKITIFTPTGSGKSQFIIKRLVPYYLGKGERVLILVNRKSLLRQYIYEMALREEKYQLDVYIMTYQEFAGHIKRDGTLKGVFDRYGLIIFDEIHFFISDSDFNPSDTYIVWQAILHSYGRCMVFMSATPEELEPFWQEYQKLVKRYFESAYSRGNAQKFWSYNIEADYGYILPEIIPDMDSLLTALAKDNRKSVIFLDDMEKGKEIKMKIKSIAHEKKVVCVDAESMDSLNQEETQVMKSLYMANRLDCDVLITTSVLDNGVSIHDKDVGNVAIFTESKSSFLQMLGRIRAEGMETVKLLMVPQPPEYWEKREKILEEEVNEINYLLKNDYYERKCDFLCDAVLSGNKMTDLYKKIFVLVPQSESFPIYDGVERPLPHAKGIYPGEKELVINRLSVAKIRQMLQTVRRMHVLSRRGLEGPCYEQLTWIGKKPEDVVCRESSFMEDEKEAMVQKFHEVKSFDKKKFSEWKKEIAEQFRKSCLQHLDIRAGSPIKEDDLEVLLKAEGLKLEVTKDDNRNNIYTIVGL